MVKRMFLTLGLGLALAGGVATSVHASSQVAARPAAVQADLIVGATEAQTADTDPNAPCATDVTGTQTGDCQDSQSTVGPDEKGGAADTAEATNKGETTGLDGDTVQSGDQTGQ